MEITNPEIVDLFKKGQIGIFPTDTAYGIGCRMDDVAAVEKVFELRNRPKEKALLVLVSSIEMAEQYVTIPNDVKKNLLEKYWPGGLTVILKCNTEKVPGIIRSDGATLAVRLPDNEELTQIIKRVRVPIVAPSANYSGQTTPVRLSEVDPTLIEKVDFVINGVCTMEGVSTIVDVSNNEVRIVRRGVITI